MGRKKFNYDARTDCVATKVCENGREAGVMQMYSGWALVTDFTNEGFDEHWLYDSEEAAMTAFNKWDGTGLPEQTFLIHARMGAAV